jgi:hypothetical protein
MKNPCQVKRRNRIVVPWFAGRLLGLLVRVRQTELHSFADTMGGDSPFGVQGRVGADTPVRPAYFFGCFS